MEVIFGIKSISNEIVENGNYDDWYDFELNFDKRFNKYSMDFETMLGFDSPDGAKKYVNNIFDIFTNWMIQKGYDISTELNLYEVFTNGININDRFDSVSDAYAAFKFAVRGFNGMGMMIKGSKG